MTASVPKTCIIGLDGATYTVLDKWIASGDMPNLGALFERGSRAALMSTMPPITGPAWTSMTTGVNPPSHGIFDFYKWGTDPTVPHLVTSRDAPLPRLWDIASSRGRKVGAYSLPLSFPAWPVNGFMVTGMLTPSPQPAMAHPADLFDELNRRDILPFGKPRKSGSARQFAQEILEHHAVHEKCLPYLLDRFAPDFLMAVFLEPDRLQHHLWPYAAQEPEGRDRKIRAWVREYFRRLDATIGALVRRFGPETHYFVASDHGFGPLSRTFHVNRFLMDEGYLAFKPRPERRKTPRDLLMGAIKGTLGAVGLLEATRGFLARHKEGLLGNLVRRGGKMDLVKAIDFSRTRAYMRSSSECGIMINLRGRSPAGIVSPGAEYDALAEELIEKIRAVRDPENGAQAMPHVGRSDRAIQGPFASNAPDIYMLSDGNYHADKHTRGPWIGPSVMNATHRVDGVFAAAGPGIRRGAEFKAQMVDVAPTALHAAGLPVPDHMEGRVIGELFDGEIAARAVERCVQNKPPFGDAPAAAPTQEEEAEVVQRLKQLGYL